MSARELAHKMYAPVLFDKNRIKPSENMNVRMPPSIIPLLKKEAEIPSMPKSLKACFVHSNQGECAMAKAMHVNITIGISIPHIPAIFVIFFILILPHCIFNRL